MENETPNTEREAAMAAWQKEIYCSGCEVCQFEGDGSCEPDQGQCERYIAGYSAGRSASTADVLELEAIVECVLLGQNIDAHSLAMAYQSRHIAHQVEAKSNAK